MLSHVRTHTHATSANILTFFPNLGSQGPRYGRCRDHVGTPEPVQIIHEIKSNEIDEKYLRENMIFRTSIIFGYRDRVLVYDRVYFCFRMPIQDLRPLSSLQL